MLVGSLPRMETLFNTAQDEIEALVATDIYPRFVRHQMTMSAAKALAGDRKKYAGLGDCFVMTTPSMADNPITFASDGFVKVTGYRREEIIPRNCRFLQGPQSDREATKRLGEAIDSRQECVELLLNYKKNGEPFWNLLYICRFCLTMPIDCANPSSTPLQCRGQGCLLPRGSDQLLDYNSKLLRHFASSVDTTRR